MRTSSKLLIVVAVQFAVLLSVIGFKQYTVWTADTVLLRTTVSDPAQLAAPGSAGVTYDISTVDRAAFPADVYGGEVWVELQRGADGYWRDVAVHQKRERAYAGTVLIKGQATWSYPGAGSIAMRYGIEQVYAPAGGALPAGSGHTVAVEVRVDRFGQATPLRFLVDGQPTELRRR
ncbi:MAG TPA: GDYXXLXY domain-containing protein [Dehalococcoidia bacterium]|nr:GDYXXLXY domain-containing protein [Dehalococcoidia bacterium]